MQMFPFPFQKYMVYSIPKPGKMQVDAALFLFAIRNPRKFEFILANKHKKQGIFHVNYYTIAIYRKP